MKRLEKLASFGLAICIGFSSAASADQTNNASPPNRLERKNGRDAIVITGTKLTRSKVESFVSSTLQTKDGQLATFHDPICPAVFGLNRAYGFVIKQRVLAVLDRAGIRKSSSPNCTANLVLLVASNPSGLVKDLRSKRPDLFDGLNLGEVDTLANETGPVRTWKSVLWQGADGRELVGASEVQMGGKVLYDAHTQVLRGSTALASRISNSVRPNIKASFVVIDTAAVGGLSLMQIADYFAMRGLLQSRGSFSPGVSTILNIFGPVSDQQPPLDQLSTLDLAILKAAYEGDGSLRARDEETSIAATSLRAMRDSPSANPHNGH